MITFLRTPKSQRHRRPKPPIEVHEAGAEYAPLYTPEERRKTILVTVLTAVPLFLLANFWFLPEFRNYAEQAHCYTFGPYSGWQVVSFFMFVVPPGTFTLILLFMGIPEFVYVWLEGQYPLPGKKVFRPTKYRYGRQARLFAAGYFALLAVCVGMTAWGYGAAGEFVDSLGSNWPPCPGVS